MAKKEENKVVYQGVRWLDLLTLLFIGLKLAGFIEWSWIWVLFPSWSVWALAILSFSASYYKTYKLKKTLSEQLDKTGEMDEETWAETLRRYEDWKDKYK